MSPPAFKLFRNGEVVEEVHGMLSEADYRAIVDKHLVPLGDKVRLAAAKAWKDGERDAAIQSWSRARWQSPTTWRYPPC